MLFPAVGNRLPDPIPPIEPVPKLPFRGLFPKELDVPPRDPLPIGPVPRDPPLNVPPTGELVPNERPKGAKEPSPFRGAKPGPRGFITNKQK